jgi:hypothetical protein
MQYVRCRCRCRCGEIQSTLTEEGRRMHVYGWRGENHWQKIERGERNNRGSNRVHTWLFKRDHDAIGSETFPSHCSLSHSVTQSINHHYYKGRLLETIILSHHLHALRQLREKWKAMWLPKSVDASNTTPTQVQRRFEYLEKENKEQGRKKKKKSSRARFLMQILINLWPMLIGH